MRQRLGRFFNDWVSKDTAYLMWLLWPFTAFRDVQDPDAGPAREAGREQPWDSPPPTMASAGNSSAQGLTFQ